MTGVKKVAYIAGYVAVNSINPFKVAKKAIKCVKTVKKVKFVSKITKKVKKAKPLFKKTSKIFKITKRSTKKSSKKVYKVATKKPPVRGYNPKGYNPKPGERTLNGYVKNNVSKDKEILLYTKSKKFTNEKTKNGVTPFKRIGSDSHGGIIPHSHQPYRNISPKGIKNGVNKRSTRINRKDVKQLYQYLNNGKYRK